MAENDVKKLLQSWNLGHLIDSFERNSIFNVFSYFEIRFNKFLNFKLCR